MWAYLKFLYLSILKKISTWIIFFIYVLSILLIIYILPAILHQSLQTTIGYVSIILFIIVIIATCASFIAASIFRSGIDDGSELLVLSKQLKRLNIIWAKVIVLITIQLFISLFCGFLVVFTKFYKYGVDNPITYIFGTFLMYFIVSLFFSSLTIFFSLKLKKSALTLISSAIAIFLSLLSFINYIVGKTPGIYNNVDSYTIQNNSLFKNNDEQKYELYSGYNLYYNNYPVTNKSTNYDGELIINNNNLNNVIESIYSANLNKTKFDITAKFDIGFQWTQLLSLSNFIYNPKYVEQSSSSASSLFISSVMSNYYLSFEQVNISKNDYLTIGNNYLPISNRDSIGMYDFSSSTPLSPLNLIDNNYYSLNSNKIYIPILDEKNQEVILKQYPNPFLNKSTDIIFDLLTNLANNKNFINYIKWLENNNTYYLNQYFLSYYFYAFNVLLKNIDNNKDLKIIDQADKIINTVKNSKLKQIFTQYLNIDLNYYNLDLDEFLTFKNINSTKSLITLCLQVLESIQLSTLSINDLSDPILLLIIANNNSNIKNSISFFALNNDNINLSELKNSELYINTLPLSTSYYDNFATFAKVKFNTYLNLYGTIFAWIGVCFIFICISTYFYYKKDFK